MRNVFLFLELDEPDEGDREVRNCFGGGGEVVEDGSVRVLGGLEGFFSLCRCGIVRSHMYRT